jgi:CRP/FNR family transcriptional regulator, cyclic AMP receptor protein
VPDWLRQHWIFAGAAAAELAPMLGAMHEVRYIAGDVLFREGEAANGLYVLRAGAVQIAAAGLDGQTVLGRVTAPDVVGEMGVLDGEPRSGTATAVGFCVTYFVPGEAFLDVVEHSHAVRVRLMVLLSQRIRRMNGRLAELPPRTSPVVVFAIDQDVLPY